MVGGGGKKRGRKPKALPEEFEEHPSDSQKVRCVSCDLAHKRSEPKYQSRKEMKKHLESGDHTQSLDCLKEEADKERAMVETLEAVYRRGAPPPLLDPRLASSSQHPTMFEEMPRGGSPPPYHHLPPQTIPAFMHPLERRDPETQRALLRQEVERLLQQAEHEDLIGQLPEDDPTRTNVSNNPAARWEAPRREATAEEIAEYLTGIPTTSDYFPYPNKIAMLLDILDGLPHLRMSSSQLQMILWLLEKCGVKHVPSYDAFRALQLKLRVNAGSEPTRYCSDSGNIFYTNDLRESVARDFANPEVAQHMHLYPEETTGPISEVWQAERWKEFHPSQLTPMYAKGHRKFYIDEVSRLSDGRTVIPRNWIQRRTSSTGPTLFADCHIIDTDSGHSWSISRESESINSELFTHTYFDIAHELEAIGKDISSVTWNSAGLAAPPMPNPLREVAGDDDLYVVMLPLWCDDVSGNKSKQYNKHINIYTANSALPGRLLQQEYFVRFVSSSPHASSHEQFAALRDQVRDTQTNPIRCFNAHTRRMCRAVLRVPSLPADNPQQSEEASHMGGSALCKCRKCKVGGAHQQTESDAGYHSLFTPGEARSAEWTKAELGRQLKTASLGVEIEVKKVQKETGIKDKITQGWIETLLTKARALKKSNPRRTRPDISEELLKWLDEQPGEKMNPLLDIEGLDPTQDTPVEILHTILLGIVKYIWHMLHTSWTEAEMDLFTVRLQSTNMFGLNSPPIRAAYMMQYRNNLIGKNFKTLMQTIAFHAHDVCTPKQFTLIKSAGELGALLWIPEIDDMETYLTDLKIVIGNVLDAFSDIQPSKIIQKIKIHVLTHLPDDIRRFGPAIRYSTEVFECFNAIFRLCSVLSNHQAPSRDIARQFASMDRLKHIISGGFWKDEKGEWVQAGKNVLEVLQSDTTIQRHIGWVSPRKVIPGHVRLKGAERHPAQTWSESKSGQAGLQHEMDIPDTVKWRMGEAVVAKSGDRCHDGSWVVARKDGVQGYILGRVKEILYANLTTPVSLVFVERFTLGGSKHPELDMPVLSRDVSTPEVSDIVIAGKDIEFEISVQHDCRILKCQPDASRHQLQEREKTHHTESLIKHADDEHFIINIHALHNAHLLRRILPRSLIEPTPLYADRAQHHADLAKELRVSQTKKRASTKAKTKATREANKAKAAERQMEFEGAAAEPEPNSDMEEDREDEAVGASDEESQAEDGIPSESGEEHSEDDSETEQRARKKRKTGSGRN